MRILDDHQEWLKNSEYKRNYDDLESEFNIAKALIAARSSAGLTQAQVAERLGVKQPTVARIESGKNISLKTITKYATAVGKPIKFEILPLLTH